MSDGSAPGETGNEDRGDSYEEAIARLDEIIGRLDSGSAELRETLELCAEAKGLIEYCAGELEAVDRGLRELRLDELAASLTGAPANAGAGQEAASSAAEAEIRPPAPQPDPGDSFEAAPPPDDVPF